MKVPGEYVRRGPQERGEIRQNKFDEMDLKEYNFNEEQLKCPRQ
jgi:hypothetical protein